MHLAMSIADGDQAQPLLQPPEDHIDYRTEVLGMEGETRTSGMRQVIQNFKQSKSFEIMKSSVTVFMRNPKLTFLMMFSTIPFFVFVVFYWIKLQKTLLSAPSSLKNPYGIKVIHLTESHSVPREMKYENNHLLFLYDILQLCLLYLVLYPLLELLSMITTVQIAVDVSAGEKQSNLKAIFSRKVNLKGVVITCGYVQLLSFLTLLGLSWIVENYLTYARAFSYPYYEFGLFDISHLGLIILTGIHILLFVLFLYKYIEWSAFWNMSIVISILEEETGLDAFGMAGYYGKHCKPTGFQLMLGFVGLNVVLRLPCLLYDGCDVGVASVVIGFVCMGNLIKWFAFVLYYLECKQQTMEKKNDAQIGKAENV